MSGLEVVPVHFSEVVPSSEVEMYGDRGRTVCPLFRGCPFFGGRDVWRQGVNSVSIVQRLSLLRR